MKTTNHWLMKSEPEVFSIDDLQRDGKAFWDGVRNYQARNFMMNEMQIGDQVLFYHSNATPPGIAGIAKVASAARPDLTALDKKSEYYDPKATADKPIWYAVEVSFVKKFKNFVSLDQVREEKPLKDMPLLRKGQRLSIQPVSAKEFEHICQLAQQPETKKPVQKKLMKKKSTAKKQV